MENLCLRKLKYLLSKQLPGKIFMKFFVLRIFKYKKYISMQYKYITLYRINNFLCGIAVETHISCLYSISCHSYISIFSNSRCSHPPIPTYLYTHHACTYTSSPGSYKLNTYGFDIKSLRHFTQALHYLPRKPHFYFRVYRTRKAVAAVAAVVGSTFY